MATSEVKRSATNKEYSVNTPCDVPVEFVDVIWEKKTSHDEVEPGNPSLMAKSNRLSPSPQTIGMKLSPCPERCVQSTSVLSCRWGRQNTRFFLWWFHHCPSFSDKKSLQICSHYQLVKKKNGAHGSFVDPRSWSLSSTG